MKAGALCAAHVLGLGSASGYNVHLPVSDGMAAISCTMQRRTLHQSGAAVQACCAGRLHRQAQVPEADCHQDLGGRSSTKSPTLTTQIASCNIASDLAKAQTQDIQLRPHLHMQSTCRR